MQKASDLIRAHVGAVFVAKLCTAKKMATFAKCFAKGKQQKKKQPCCSLDCGVSGSKLDNVMVCFLN